MPEIRAGLDSLVADPSPIVGKRIGLLTNHAAVARDLSHAVSLLRNDPRWQLVALFGPEHGIWGEAQDMAGVEDMVDPATGLRVRSLYGAREEDLAPRRSDLEGLDALVVDLQDVGSRYYTFVYTMAHCMRAAARAGVEVVVLDRPNPVSGAIVEGNVLDMRFSSFVGMYPLPVRHGMTAGELARWFERQDGSGCRLTVVPVSGLTRRMWWSDTGLPWVLPSPNMPTPDTATVYPGMCLVEGTNLSEGRGTTRPFEIWGAPWLDSFRLAAALNSLGLPGVRFRPHWFKPTFQKHAGRVCGGVQIHVTDRGAFRPYETGLWCIKVAHDQAPAAFDWRREVYEFVGDRLAIDLLAGTDHFRRVVENGENLRDWIASWEHEAPAFRDSARELLLYA
jgi:uncharacterized protein YbbC (DUF1343 family)